jgi:hypothetical protein
MQPTLHLVKPIIQHIANAKKAIQYPHVSSNKLVK